MMIILRSILVPSISALLHVYAAAIPVNRNIVIVPQSPAVIMFVLLRKRLKYFTVSTLWLRLEMTSYEIWRQSHIIIKTSFNELSLLIITK